MELAGYAFGDPLCRAIDHLPDAPFRIDRSEEAAEQALCRLGRQVVTDEDPQDRALADRGDIESQPVAADDQKPRRADGLPCLVEGRLAFANHLIEKKVDAEHSPGHPDMRSDSLTAPLVERCLHA